MEKRLNQNFSEKKLYSVVESDSDRWFSTDIFLEKKF